MIPQADWTSEDFKEWATRCGLSVTMIETVLGLSRATVHRMRAGGRIGRAEQMACIAFESANRTTGDDGIGLDGFAADSDFADLCAVMPFAHITGITSAIARGWSSASLAGLRTIAQPERLPRVARSGSMDVLTITALDMPYGIEVRRDEAGDLYRIATPVRTLLDLADHPETCGAGLVYEAFASALHRGHVAVEELFAAAARRGSLDRVRQYIPADMREAA